MSNESLGICGDKYRAPVSRMRLQDQGISQLVPLFFGQ